MGNHKHIDKRTEAVLKSLDKFLKLLDPENDQRALPVVKPSQSSLTWEIWMVQGRISNSINYSEINLN